VQLNEIVELPSTDFTEGDRKNELFGVINPTSRKFVDGKSLCINIIFARGCSNVVYI